MSDTTIHPAPGESRGPLRTWRFEGQTRDQHATAGTVEAPTHGAAAATLDGMGLRVLSLSPEPDADGSTRRPRVMSGADFQAFNAQLGQLAKAGLPLESGLRLIARDVASPRLRATIGQVASALEGGASLEEAFERHKALLPPLYAGIVAAGVKSGNLSAVLFSLGRHLELVGRLRAALWRMAAYPLVVFVAMIGLSAVIGLMVVPSIAEVLVDFDVDLPWTTRAMIASAPWVPTGLAVAVGALAAVVLGWVWLKATGRSHAALEAVVFPLPGVGRVLHRNLIARWCDALRVGVEAGLDLPAALQLSGDAVASPGLKRDAVTLCDALRDGRSLDRLAERLRLAPATVPAAIQLGSQRHNLPDLLSHLARMYEEESEARLASMQAWLTPLLLVVIAALISFVLSAMFMPLIRLIQAVS